MNSGTESSRRSEPAKAQGEALQYVFNSYMEEFRALRQDITQQIRLKLELAVAVIIAAGALTPFLPNRATGKGEEVLLVMPPLLCLVVLVEAWISRNISRMAGYHQELRTRVRKLISDLDDSVDTEGVLGWELYIQRTRPPVTGVASYGFGDLAISVLLLLPASILLAIFPQVHTMDTTWWLAVAGDAAFMLATVVGAWLVDVKSQKDFLDQVRRQGDEQRCDRH